MCDRCGINVVIRWFNKVELDYNFKCGKFFEFDREYGESFFFIFRGCIFFWVKYLSIIWIIF